MTDGRTHRTAPDRGRRSQGRDQARLAPVLLRHDPAFFSWRLGSHTSHAGRQRSRIGPWTTADRPRHCTAPSPPRLGPQGPGVASWCQGSLTNRMIDRPRTGNRSRIGSPIRTPLRVTGVGRLSPRVQYMPPVAVGRVASQPICAERPWCGTRDSAGRHGELIAPGKVSSCVRM